MTHVRHRHTTHFTVVGNHLAQHPTLSSTAIGIAVRIQSLPDGTRVGIRALAERLPESEYKIAAALNELEAAGYLRRSRERAAGQRIVTRTTFYECPDTERRPLVRPALHVRPAPATGLSPPTPPIHNLWITPHHRPTLRPPRRHPRRRLRSHLRHRLRRRPGNAHPPPIFSPDCGARTPDWPCP
ncbi:hypothetical protein [Streptomyces celluloflavus]|uniref:hypothetical protein n=1 Tax=Streptomyces celluloflavus TaxID=58344 RepID=UPI00369287C9